MVVDEGESVRVNALKQTALLCKNASLATRALLLKECFTSCTRDKSWRVRIAAAESLPAVAEACKDEGSPLSDELRGPLEAMYKALQSDHESEVRVAAALRGAEAAAALGTAFGEKHIFPTVSRLANDANSVSRVELSTVCIELAAPLGKAAALEHVLPCLALLADDELSNVRLAVIMQLGPFIDVVGLDGEAAAMLPLLERLGADKNWRVRHVILHLLPQLAATLGPAEFWSHFGEVCARRASDSCALVREDWVVLMAEICGLGGFGQAWAEETLLPIVTALSGEQSYLLRAVIPSFTAGFAQILTPGSLETKLVPAVLEMASDRVPNLRMIAARALAACTPLVDPGLARETIVPKLQEMLGDGDVDVKSEADAALESDKLKGFC